MNQKNKYRLIIGLGNPSSEYSLTYHNVGFLAIDYFAKNPSISNSQFLSPRDISRREIISKSRFHRELSTKSEQAPKFQNPCLAGRQAKSKNFEYLKINGLILIKPLTFMNESGKAVAASLKYFKAKPEEILVIHDDADIELGKSKLSFGCGAAGHKGVQSIIDELKTSARGAMPAGGQESAAGGKNFSRLRIGIRPKASSIKHPASAKASADAKALADKSADRQASKRKKAGLPAETYRAKAGEMVLKRITPADKLILDKLLRELKI